MDQWANRGSCSGRLKAAGAMCVLVLYSLLFPSDYSYSTGGSAGSMSVHGSVGGIMLLCCTGKLMQSIPSGSEAAAAADCVHPTGHQLH